MLTPTDDRAQRLMGELAIAYGQQRDEARTHAIVMEIVSCPLLAAACLLRSADLLAFVGSESTHTAQALVRQLS